MTLALLHTIADLRTTVRRWRRDGESVALVPTMGALHEGHISLVRLAKERARRVVATIFVNPTQFAANEDFSAYPRTLEADCAKLRAAGTDVCFAPQARDIYPQGFATQVIPTGAACVGLEDRFRPDHFAGVALVVAKLLNIAQADDAFFGEKDYQQLAVIRQMVRDLDIPTRIFGAPTMREADGLAMSSRNIYLSADERRVAATLPQSLFVCASAARDGQGLESAAADACAALQAVGFLVDYVAFRHAETLATVTALDEGPLRLLAAARLGKTRLIDNIAV